MSVGARLVSAWGVGDPQGPTGATVPKCTCSSWGHARSSGAIAQQVEIRAPKSSFLPHWAATHTPVCQNKNMKVRVLNPVRVLGPVLVVNQARVLNEFNIAEFTLFLITNYK